jgi:hypothetical protein
MVLGNVPQKKRGRELLPIIIYSKHYASWVPDANLPAPTQTMGLPMNN